MGKPLKTDRGLRGRVRIVPLAAGLAAATLCAASARAVDRLPLTIASSHMTKLPWAGVMHARVVPQLDERLEARGGRPLADWDELPNP